LKHKILNRVKLKKLKKLFLSKSFLGSIFFAIGLWGYTSLNLNYVTFVQVPLEIILPENRAKENELPSNVSLKVRGTGWHLFYLIFFNSSAKCYLDLSQTQVTKEEYKISRNDLIKSVIDLISVETIDVIPESVTLISGLKEEKKVPVIPNIMVNTREFFCKVGAIKLVPDSVIIWGNKKVIDSINEWKTEPLVMNDLHSFITVPVKLFDTLSNRVQLSELNVNANINVQQISEITIDNIPIIIKGGSIKSNQILMPSQISVTIRGGIDIISKLSNDVILPTLDYLEIIDDSIGILKPSIILPRDVTLVRVSPPYIYHIIRESSPKSVKAVLPEL
jgi:hypothetical protein